MRAQESGGDWHGEPDDLPAVGEHVEVETRDGQLLRGTVRSVDSAMIIALGGADLAVGGLRVGIWHTWPEVLGEDGDDDDQVRVRWRYAPEPTLTEPTREDAGPSIEDALDRQRREAVEWAASRWTSLTPEGRAAMSGAPISRKLAAVRDALAPAAFQPIVQVEFATPAMAREAASALNELGMAAKASSCCVRFPLGEVLR